MAFLWEFNPGVGSWFGDTLGKLRGRGGQEGKPSPRRLGPRPGVSTDGVLTCHEDTDLSGEMLLHVEFGRRPEGPWLWESLCHPSRRQTWSHELKDLGAQG